MDSIFVHKIQSNGLGFCTYKSSPVDSISFWPSTCPNIDRTKKTFKTHSQQSHSHSLPLSISLFHSHSLSLSFPLAPSPSVALSLHFSLSFPLAPALLLRRCRPLCSVAVAPSRSITPSPPRSAFLPQTLILVGSAGSLSQK